MSYIISAFPGCGKSYIHSKFKDRENMTADSDSSQFSWILDENGKSTGVRNPEFPANYILHIKELVKKGTKFIFVSTHHEVRKALEDAGFTYILVYPTLDSKETFMGYYRQRNSPESFIKLMDEKWEDFVTSCSSTKESKKIIKNPVDSNIGLAELFDICCDSPYSGNMCYLWEN